MPTHNNVSGISFTLGLDPGSKNTGFAVYSHPDTRIVSWGEMNHVNKDNRGNVVEKMESRKNNRRLRKSQKAYRKPRFNRSRNEVGLGEFIPPSMRSHLSAHLKLVRFLLQNHAIDEIIIEEAKFDIRQLQSKKTLEGEMYQESPLGEFDKKKDLVFDRDGHECVYCGREYSLTIDHINPKATHRYLKGELKNMVTACKQCNNEKGSQTASEFGYEDIQKQIKNETKRRFAEASKTDYLNCLLKKWLGEGQLYVEDEEQEKSNLDKHNFAIDTTRGFFTSYYRNQIGWPKTKRHDASIIATRGKNRRLPTHYLDMNWVGRPSRRLHYDNKLEGGVLDEVSPNAPATITDFNGREIEVDNGDLLEYRGQHGKKSERGFVQSIWDRNTNKDTNETDYKIQLCDVHGDKSEHGGYRNPSGFVKICDRPRLRYEMKKNEMTN